MDDALHGKHKYLIQLQKVLNKESTQIKIEISDLKDFYNLPKDAAFLERILINTHRYIGLFQKVIDEILGTMQPSVFFKDEDQTPFEIIMNQRKFNISQNQQKSSLPPELLRNYELTIIYSESMQKEMAKNHS